MKRPIQLSVHRNTVEARRKRELAKELAAQVAGLVRERDIRAYGFVGIGSDGKAYALWDTGAIMPARAFSAMIGQALSDDVHNAMNSDDVTEDWRPNFPPKPLTD